MRQPWFMPTTLAILALLPGPTQAQVIDQVRKKSGTVGGTIVEMTALKVVIEKRGSQRVEVPVHEITSIAFSGEPRALTQARQSISGSRFEQAQKELAGLDPAAAEREPVRQDIEFYRAVCAARLALAGKGAIDSAGKQMYQFVTGNETSYHYLTACEILADLLVRRGKFGRAESYYAKLAAAPAAELRIRSGLRLGQMLEAQKKYPEAIARFDEVLALTADSRAARRYQAEATLAKSTCLARTGQVDAAIDAVQNVIAETSPENSQLHALAYLALGNCYLAANRAGEAILAFLHVDLLYPSQSESHAEALYHLASLWKTVGKPNRAREARGRLQEQYPLSRWNRP